MKKTETKSVRKVGGVGEYIGEYIIFFIKVWGLHRKVVVFT